MASLAGFAPLSPSAEGLPFVSSVSVSYSSILTLAENDNGGVALYLNQNGQVVTVAENTRYTDNMLNTYGTEWVNSEGVREGGITLGATVRAFGDWIGLDGTFGLDGGFPPNDEGSAVAGNGAGGAGGGSPNLPNDDDDDNGGPKPPPIPYVNPKPLPSGNPIDPDQPKPPKVLHPILLDLDGNGIQLTDLNRSTVFMEGEEGLKHRTAWAGAGDGVLFYDADNDGTISDIREYVFTEWDPTAKDDLAAPRSRFDTNGDGKLTGTELTGFKVMKTNADGSLNAVTLASLGITQINLTEDTTHIELPDGSVITGQGTFVMGGVEHTLANTTLATEADGSRVEETRSLVNGVRGVVQTGYDTAGAVDFVIRSVSNAAGTNISNTFDDNDDGVVDRTQVIATVTNVLGVKVKTLINSLGAGGAAVLANRTVTTTSATGIAVTIERDTTGGGRTDQRKVSVFRAAQASTGAHRAAWPRHLRRDVPRSKAALGVTDRSPSGCRTTVGPAQLARCPV